LPDAHIEAGDHVGGDYWIWVAETDRRPDYYNTYWWYDNTLLYPTESRFAIPAAACWLMERGVVKLPSPVPTEDHSGETYSDGAGFKTDIGEGGGNAKISEIGFDGRLTAETTLLRCWRKMTPTERQKAKEWDFDFLDPIREEGDKAK
jgi:hypothetical protein